MKKNTCLKWGNSRLLYFLSFSLLFLSISSRANDVASFIPSFEEIELDASPAGPAFIKASDLNNDGKPEVIVSMFGNSPVSAGSVEIYAMGSDIYTWTKTQLAGSDTRFPNEVGVYDVNEDGRKDIILPGGFLACTFPFGSCGSMNWYLQEEDGSFSQKHLAAGRSRFYHHVQFVDFDFDGKKDIVAVGEEKGSFDDGSSLLQYFKGDESLLGFARTPTDVTVGLGSFPTVIDIDNNGDWEVFSSEYFGSTGSFSWVDQDETGTWNRYYVDSTVGKSIQFEFVENLFGEGKSWAVGANHTNTTDDSNEPESAIYVYEVPDFNDPDFDPNNEWSKVKISEGIVSVGSPFFGPQGAPGVFSIGDVDGDGALDVAVHGDGDPRIFLLRQEPDKTFTTHIIADEIPQGGVEIADLDGDGIGEIIASSYENGKLIIYKLN